MRAAFLVAAIVATPGAALAQTSATPARSVLDTRIPPNAADRALATNNLRDAENARRAAADRARADSAARAATTRGGPVSGSTMTDGVAGLGTRPDTASPQPPQ